ncbi:neuropeptide-like 1 [Bacillus rossius redtenbacheri]|uniref:neuropeptide-like 1 n=1 Tax=Bacillus rossius redtenbacheri TaxID=93214 RepID=UPI002FDEF0B1
MTRWLCALALLVAFSLQVRADGPDKRNLGSLARSRMLPAAGKRYVAALARNGDLPYFAQRQWHKKLHPMVSGGGLGADKRFAGGEEEGAVGRIEAILRDIMDTEERWRRQRDDLKLELLKLEVDELQDEDDDVKRSVSSLVRTGGLPYKSPVGKRNVEALARAGYLPAPKEPQSDEDMDSENSDENNRMGKRSIASLAAGGGFQYPGGDKRGGIEALARNGYLHRDSAADLDGFIQQLYDQEALEKRNLGSLARSFGLPSGGKRNLGSFARSGGFSAIRTSPSKKGDEDEGEGDDGQEDEKRNLGSFARTRQRPLEGKRYLASALRGRSYSKKDDDEEEEEEEVKRHVGSMARGSLFPYGKRFLDDMDESREQFARDLAGADGDPEQKRHLGSLLHKKSSRSTGSDLAAYHSNDTAAGDPSSRLKTSEAGRAPEDTSGKRTKRQAYLVPAPPAELSDEYPMPVIQNSELFDYEDMDDLLAGEDAPSKRFLGRIPQMGPRRRPKNWSGHHRRAHSRSD